MSKSYGTLVNGWDRVSAWERSSTDGAECRGHGKSWKEWTLAKCVRPALLRLILIFRATMELENMLQAPKASAASQRESNAPDLSHSHFAATQIKLDKKIRFDIHYGLC